MTRKGFAVVAAYEDVSEISKHPFFACIDGLNYWLNAQSTCALLLPLKSIMKVSMNVGGSPSEFAFTAPLSAPTIVVTSHGVYYTQHHNHQQKRTLNFPTNRIMWSLLHLCAVVTVNSIKANCEAS